MEVERTSLQRIIASPTHHASSDFSSDSELEPEPVTTSIRKKAHMTAKRASTDNNVPIKKGFLNTGRGLKSNRLWFVLSCKELAWYSDETEQSSLYGIALSENIKFADGLNVYKDQSRLDLLVDSEELLEEWTVCLLTVGVFPIALEDQDDNLVRRRPTDDEISDFGDFTNPQLRRQIGDHLCVGRLVYFDCAMEFTGFGTKMHRVYYTTQDFYRRSLIAELSARLDADTLKQWIIQILLFNV